MPKVPVLGGATGLVGQAFTHVLAKRGWQVETQDTISVIRSLAGRKPPAYGRPSTAAA